MRKRPAIIFVLDAAAGVSALDLENISWFANKHNPRGEKLPFPVESKRIAGKVDINKSLSILKNDEILMFYVPRVIDEQLVKKSKDMKVEPNQYIKKRVKTMAKNLITKQVMKERLGSRGPYNTFNFKYTAQQAKELMAVSMFNVLANVEKIRAEMKKYVLAYIARKQAKGR